jgi:hypothetical protein
MPYIAGGVAYALPRGDGVSKEQDIRSVPLPFLLLFHNIFLTTN